LSLLLSTSKHVVASEVGNADESDTLAVSYAPGRSHSLFAALGSPHAVMRTTPSTPPRANFRCQKRALEWLWGFRDGDIMLTSQRWVGTLTGWRAVELQPRSNAFKVASFTQNRWHPILDEEATKFARDNWPSPRELQDAVAFAHARFAINAISDDAGKPGSTRGARGNARAEKAQRATTARRKAAQSKALRTAMPPHRHPGETEESYASRMRRQQTELRARAAGEKQQKTALELATRERPLEVGSRINLYWRGQWQWVSVTEVMQCQSARSGCGAVWLYTCEYATGEPGVLRRECLDFSGWKGAEGSWKVRRTEPAPMTAEQQRAFATSLRHAPHQTRAVKRQWSRLDRELCAVV